MNHRLAIIDGGTTGLNLRVRRRVAGIACALAFAACARHVPSTPPPASPAPRHTTARATARPCAATYELGFIDRIVVPACRTSFEHLDFDHPAIGTIGPYPRRIVAVLHNEGGSGSPFSVAIFQRVHGTLRDLADIMLDGHLESLAIRGDRLIVTGGYLYPRDADCCPSGIATYVIESRRDGFLLERTWHVRRTP